MDPTIRAIGSARTSEIGVDSYASLAADKKHAICTPDSEADYYTCPLTR